MRRLDRYVWREMAVPFAVGALMVMLLFQANTYIWLAKNFNLDNIPLAAQFQFILFQTPGYLRMTLPVGCALGTALAMTRLARESELTAMRAAGAPVLRVVRPMAVFGAVVGIANAWIVNELMPVATRRAREVAQKNAMLGLSNTFKSNAFLQLDRFAATFGTVVRLKDESLQLADALLIERSGNAVTMLITAKTGVYRRGVWTLSEAKVFRVDGLDIYPLGAKRMVIDQQASFDQIFNAGRDAMSRDEATTPELRQEISATLAASGNARPAQVALYERFAVPASCLVFAITSPVFAVRFARSGGFVGVLVSFVIVLLYYNAFVISTQILGKMESMPAWLAAWLPNLVFGFLGVLAIRRLE